MARRSRDLARTLRRRGVSRRRRIARSRSCAQPLRRPLSILGRPRRCDDARTGQPVAAVHASRSGSSSARELRRRVRVRRDRTGGDRSAASVLRRVARRRWRTTCFTTRPRDPRRSHRRAGLHVGVDRHTNAASQAVGIARRQRALRHRAAGDASRRRRAVVVDHRHRSGAAHVRLRVVVADGVARRCGDRRRTSVLPRRHRCRARSHSHATPARDHAVPSAQRCLPSASRCRASIGSCAPPRRCRSNSRAKPRTAAARRSRRSTAAPRPDRSRRACPPPIRAGNCSATSR